MRWVGVLAPMAGEKTCIQVFGEGNLRERDYMEDLGIEFIKKTNKCAWIYECNFII